MVIETEKEIVLKVKNFCGRSLVYSSIGKYKLALKDAEDALQLNDECGTYEKHCNKSYENENTYVLPSQNFVYVFSQYLLTRKNLKLW